MAISITLVNKQHIATQKYTILPNCTYSSANN